MEKLWNLSELADGWRFKKISYQIAWRLLLEELCWLYLGSICLEFCLNTGSTLFPTFWVKLYVIFVILLCPVKLECWGDKHNFPSAPSFPVDVKQSPQKKIASGPSPPS